MIREALHLAALRARNAVLETAVDVLARLLEVQLAARAARIAATTNLTYFQARVALRSGMNEAEIYKAVLRGEYP